MHDPFILAGKTYTSRLLVGTGRYQDARTAKAAIEASGAEIVTVAVRRVNLQGGEDSIQTLLDPQRYTYLPNTAGCTTATEAVRTLKLAHEIGGWRLVKLEVINDAKTLYPDVIETLLAAKELVKDGFEVMAYTTDDPIMARKLEDAGCAAILPLGAPIGSGLGILNPLNIRLIAKQARVPVLVDAGIGTPSDACLAMELGCAGVLLNSAISDADNPALMARAMRLAVEAGRSAYLAGRMEKKGYAEASSPTEGMVG